MNIFFLSLLLTNLSLAFPGVLENLQTRQTTPASVISQAETNCGPVPCAAFNAKEQYVSTTGQHAYASPAASQIRGPCPGLNAAANHGYIPRSGVLTITQTITGLAAAYGMAADLSAFLAAFAVVLDGDPVTMTWSIGGPPPFSTLSGLLSPPQGISYSHNKYEGDVSIGRPDAYTNNGDAHSLDVNRFKAAYKVGMGNNRYTMDLFRQAFQQNQKVSVANNPYYFSPPVAGTLVAPAAYFFVINFMSNHTAAEPNGYLDGNLFKTFFAVSGDYPNFKWNRGQERIPDNWYRRPTSNQYTANEVAVDLNLMFAAYPQTFRVGGNTNGVNTYKGADLSLLTGGAYPNPESNTQSYKCFIYQTLQTTIPDEIKGVVKDVTGALNLLNKYAKPALVGNALCPKLAKYNNNALSGYPGRTYSPTGPATNYK